MKVRIVVTKVAIIDTNDISDNHVRAAVERTNFNKGTNLDKLWIKDWIDQHSVDYDINVVVEAQ